MLEHMQSDGAGSARRFYNVGDFIDDLRNGKLGAPTMTADAAYRLGVIDGRYGLTDYCQHAAPFTAEYAQGYAVGQGKVVQRLPLTTPVILRNGVLAVISGHSTADCNSYRVSWFDRHVWQTRHKWIERGSFEVTGSAASADESAPAA